jgi:hypothetical protein
MGSWPWSLEASTGSFLAAIKVDLIMVGNESRTLRSSKVGGWKDRDIERLEI